MRLGVFVVVALTGCERSPYALDELLRLNHVQAHGTHNSYHLQQEMVIDPGHAYSHPPLDRQLELGVRQLELDIHLNISGRFEVFHLPGGVDSKTTCLALAQCLSIVRDWSDRNPDHFPLMIWLEPKDEDFDWADMNYQLFLEHHAELEAEILSVLPAERILWPDEVRGEYATLPEAIANVGWPTLGELRGRVLFALLDGENHRARYVADAPNLAGRLFFADAEDETAPYAAAFKINDARHDGEQIRRLVAAGFLVTTTLDDVASSTTSNASRIAASIDSGAHFLSTDFDESVLPARCNPLSAPRECTSAEIERLR